MLEQLPWVLIIGTALLLAAQLFVVLGAFKHLLAHDQLPPFAAGSAPFISVIVPARNEAEHLAGLLNDLREQDFPADRFEVILVDDGSHDGTLEIARRFAKPGLSFLQLVGNTGKKAAIELGVAHANGDIIVVTDADARCGPLRLSSIAQAWQRERFDLLLMPIAVRSDNSLLQELQANEQGGFMAVAIASVRAGNPMIANGANMAFRRSVFEALGGYDGNRHMASGDDMFLLETMRDANKTVTCLAVPEVVVTVEPTVTWRSFLDQRLRWAGKMKAMHIGAASVLPVFALLIPVLLWACTFTGVPPLLAFMLWIAWLVPLVAMTTAVNGVIGRQPSPFAVAMDLVLFSVYAPIVAVLSLFVRPDWKGRKSR